MYLSCDRFGPRLTTLAYLLDSWPFEVESFELGTEVSEKRRTYYEG